MRGYVWAHADASDSAAELLGRSTANLPRLSHQHQSAARNLKRQPWLRTESAAALLDEQGQGSAGGPLFAHEIHREFRVRSVLLDPLWPVVLGPRRILTTE